MPKFEKGNEEWKKSAENPNSVTHPDYNGETARGRGRPGRLDDPEYAKLVAAMFIEGQSRQQMSDSLGISKSTLTIWRRDPRVRAHARKLIEDRLQRVVGKIDAIIEYRIMNHADELSVDDLIKIRKELFGGTMRAEIEGKADDLTANEALNALDNNPGLIEQMNELLGAAKAAD